MELHFAAAFDFYHAHINRSDFFKLLREHNLKTSGSVPSITWELFGSILTGRRGKAGYGADLEGVEVKSAIYGSSFEYQYHLNTGLEKLKEDQVVDHFFCSYSADYQSFQVFFAEGRLLTPFFSKWIPEYLKNYKKSEKNMVLEASERRQRFRRSIPFGWISKNGRLVMQVTAGRLIIPVGDCWTSASDN
jgi:hypothetical protein